MAEQLTAELSVLHEIAGLASELSEESVCREAMSKAIRLFSVRYFALISITDGRQLAMSGCAALPSLPDRTHTPAPNRFSTVLSQNDRPVLLFMEHADPLGSRERRLFTIFSRSLEQALVTARSIADRKRVEEELRQANKSLEDRAQQLEAAVADLQVFAYIVSHDLRSPLRMIAGYAEMLAEDYGGKLDERGVSLIDRITSRCGRMQRLLEDILVFSRVSRHEFQRRPIDMNDIVQGVYEDVAVVGDDRAIEVTIHSLPPAQGDPEMIRLVMTNLLNNAIKFTRIRERAMITVRGQSDGTVSQYTVTDNGIGFDPQYAEKLFGVFQRLHTDQNIEGSGLGLAIVRHIVEKCGGRVWGEGKPDAGASFHFTLPA